MSYPYQPSKVKDYTTNCGVCFVFQDQHKYLLFASSDYNFMNEFIFKGDSELYVDRKFFFVDHLKSYEITKVEMYSNPGSVMEYEREQMMGKMNPYSYKITLTVKEIQS